MRCKVWVHKTNLTLSAVNIELRGFTWSRIIAKGVRKCVAVDGSGWVCSGQESEDAGKQGGASGHGCAGCTGGEAPTAQGFGDTLLHF